MSIYFIFFLDHQPALINHSLIINQQDYFRHARMALPCLTQSSLTPRFEALSLNVLGHLAFIIYLFSCCKVFLLSNLHTQTLLQP